MLSLGCGAGIVQTALRREAPRAPLDCESAEVAAKLPTDATFGDGSEPRSILTGDSYAAGEGPGLYVTARDVFRVYLNGELVFESLEPRAPTFIPLSLLPGDNA